MKAIRTLLVVVAAGLVVAPPVVPAHARPAAPSWPDVVLRERICQAETGYLPDRLRDVQPGPPNDDGERALGYCQLMPGTAAWLADKYDLGPIDRTDRATSRLLADLHIVYCRGALRRQFGRAPIRSIAWCYVSGRASLSPPKGGEWGRYVWRIAQDVQDAWMRLAMVHQGMRIAGR